MRNRKRVERGPQPWRFFQDVDSRWRWKYVMNGKAVAKAHAAFAAYEDCVADARTHGYRDAALNKGSDPGHIGADPGYDL